MEASRRPKTKKIRQLRSNVKVLLTVFFDCNGLVRHELLPHIINITLMLCADCAKQFVRNAQNCAKTNHGFYTMRRSETHKIVEKRIMDFAP